MKIMIVGTYHMAGSPSDILQIGSGHGALLREFIRQAPHLELVDPLPDLA